MSGKHTPPDLEISIPSSARALNLFLFRFFGLDLGIWGLGVSVLLGNIREYGALSWWLGVRFWLIWGLW